MCSGKLFYHETIYNSAGADLARRVQKYSAMKRGEGGDTEALYVTDEGSSLCPWECTGSGPYTLPPCRRVTHMTTSVCLSVHPPFCQILPFPPAPLNTCSPMKPLPSRALQVAERPWMGSARCRDGISQGLRHHRAGGRPRSLVLQIPSRLWIASQHWSHWKTMERGEGLVPFLPCWLRSLHKQVIFVPTHPTDSSGLNVQAVPSPSCIIKNTTGPMCQISLLTMAG